MVRSVIAALYRRNIKAQAVSGMVTVTIFETLNVGRAYSRKGVPKIFGSGMGKKKHNEDLNALCSSPRIIRVIKSSRLTWAGRVARAAEEGNEYSFMEIHVGNRPLGRPTRRWILK